jgi:hypothetical protein
MDPDQHKKLTVYFYVLRPIMRGPAATPCTPARRGRTRQAARDLNTANMADSYFHAQSEKVRWLLIGVLHGA